MAVRVTQTAAEAVLGAAVAAANVRVSQEAVEAVVGPAGVFVTQEAVEAVLQPPVPYVRVTSEALEAVVSAVTAASGAGGTEASAEHGGSAQSGIPEPAAFTVRAIPLVRWDAVAEDPNHPRGTFRVLCRPRIEWGGTEIDPFNRWFVECKPKVSYVTGPGTASTECISADGVVPPPEEPPPEGPELEQNYVF